MPNYSMGERKHKNSSLFAYFAEIIYLCGTKCNYARDAILNKSNYARDAITHNVQSQQEQI